VADARLWEACPTRVELTADGVRRRYDVDLDGPVVHVDGVGGSSVLVEVDPLPEPGAVVGAGSMQAPLPGAVVRVEVAAGDPVAAGQVLVVLEAMKMEHAVVAAVDGTVAEVLVAVGDQVDGGQILVRVDEVGDDG
jgi:acyl-CoA carboxylase subunit alpha